MISLSGMVTGKFDHTTPHQMIPYKGSILLYNKSIIDIWNIGCWQYSLAITYRYTRVNELFKEAFSGKM